MKYSPLYFFFVIMCYVHGKESKGPKRAKKDIECWKEMDLCPDNNLLYSPIMTGPGYKLGDTIHCAVRKFKNNRLNAFWLRRRRFLEGEVVHAYISKNFPNHWYHTLVKCIIPKGSYYWTDGEEIVAFDIRLKEIIKESISVY